MSYNQKKPHIDFFSPLEARFSIFKEGNPLKQIILKENNKIDDTTTYENNTLTFKNDAPSFLITGCQGAGSIFGDQAGVAKAMREFYLKSDNKNRAGILLGDNFYNSGVTHPKDPLFKKHFYEMYEGLNIPFFNILGNHDYNFQRLNFSLIDIHPMQRAMAQVDHTYCAKSSDGHPHWIMPARYYALNYTNTNFFMLDSSTFCFDLNQRNWLESTYKTLNSKDSEKWNILVMHHPLVSYGKRHPGVKKSDIDLYILREYGDIEIFDATMNQWIFEMIWSMDITFDLQLCAHDHFLGFSKIEGNPYSKKQSFSPSEVQQHQQKMSWRNFHNEAGLSVPPDFTPTNDDEPLTFNKLPSQKMLKKGIMFQALVGGGGASPHGLKHKDPNNWTKEHFGFLDLKIGETLDLTYHHWNSRFSFGTNQKICRISRDPLLNKAEDEPTQGPYLL